MIAFNLTAFQEPSRIGVALVVCGVAPFGQSGGCTLEKQYLDVLSAEGGLLGKPETT